MRSLSIKLSCLLRIFIANFQYFAGGGRFKKRRTFITLLLIPYAFVRSCLLLPKPLVFRQITFVISTKCTLKCKKCNNLMPYYRDNHNPYDIPAEHCMASFSSLAAAIDCIYEVNIIGGEPFLHEELDLILKFCIDEPKIKKISITTNGTICPKDDLAITLKHPKILVFISDYGVYSKNIEKLIIWLKEHRINYISQKPSFWFDAGDVSPRHRNFKYLKKMFFLCRMPQCVIFLNGKIHHCALSAHGMDLGIIPDNPKDYVDVTAFNKGELRKKIEDFRLKTASIVACDYCDLSKIIPVVKIPVGEQKN